MLVTVIALSWSRPKFLIRRRGGDVVSRCLNYRPGHYTSAGQPAAA
jgi:hypothetical protein